MFAGLSKKLLNVFSGIKNRGILTPEIIDNTIREIRISMLEADVALPVVRNVTNTLREKLSGQEIIKSTSPEQTISKYLHDEIVSLLGENNAAVIRNGTILMCGLQGSGKTTTSAKLANMLTKKYSKKVMLVSLDTTRAAAIEQLQILASQNGISFFEDFKSTDNPLSIAKKAMKAASDFDITIFDTAGRMYVDDSLMKELVSVRDIVKPRESFLVIDSMMGQDALKSAISFNNLLSKPSYSEEFQGAYGTENRSVHEVHEDSSTGATKKLPEERRFLTGLIMTRIDGDNKGGACLSAKSVTNCQIRYMCTGEKIDNIENFYPDRIASRILDNGDIISLVEKAIDQNIDMELKKSKDFNMNDMEKQLKQIEKMGGIAGFLKFIPGIGKIKDKIDGMNVEGKAIARQVAIIRSMTKKEKMNPIILNASRRRRIAKGSGTQVQDVNKLIKQFDGIKLMMKKMEKAENSKNPQAMLERLLH